MSLDASPVPTASAPGDETVAGPRARARWRRRVETHALFVVGALVALAVWALNLVHYFPFFSDDGFISLRYAARWLDGQGLTWTDGERVEGYSNLLYLLLCALVGTVSDLVGAARIVGLSGVLLLALAIFRAGRSMERAAWMAVPMVWLPLAAMGPIAIWAIGGLEATLLVGLLTLGYVEWLAISPRALQRPLAAVARTWPLALACWTRPDAAIFVAFLAAWEVSRGRRQRQAFVRGFLAAVLPGLFVIGQAAFRWVYYGDLVPNSARVKAELGLSRLHEGVQYVREAFEGAWLLVGLAALGVYAAWVARHRRAEVSLTVGAAAIWLAYVALIGGDVLPGWRHAVPAYGLFALGGLWGLEWLLLVPRGVAGSRWQGALVLLGMAASGTLFVAQRHDPGNRRAVSERWEWSAEPVGKLYRRFAARRPLMAVEPAGALPYYSGLPALDMFGLCDRQIASQKARPGRDLAHDHGDGLYVWRRKPDLMVLAVPWGGRAYSASGQEMLELPGYRQLYRDLVFRAVDPFDVRATAQVRIDGRLGWLQSDDRIEVPGYFFQGMRVSGHAVAGGGVGALVEGRVGGFGPRLHLTPGVWRLVVRGASPWLGVHLRNRSAQDLVGDLDAGLLRVSAPADLEVRVSTVDGVETEFEAVHWVKVHEPFVGAEKLAAGAEIRWRTPALIPPSHRGAWRLLELDGPRGFGDGDAANRRTGAPESSECAGALPGIRTDLRFDSYANDRREGWTGEALGPAFTIPANALAFVCTSGARHSAGLRLRLTDTQEIVRAWLGHESAEPRALASDLSSYAGRPARFEAYDRRTDSWGHVRVHGLAVAVPSEAHLVGPEAARERRATESPRAF